MIDYTKIIVSSTYIYVFQYILPRLGMYSHQFCVILPSGHTNYFHNDMYRSLQMETIFDEVNNKLIS